MTFTHFRPLTRFARPLSLVLALALAGVACGKTGDGAAAPSAAAVSPDTWAVVDGRTISRGEVEKALRRSVQQAPGPMGEEALAAELNLLDELIVQDLLLARAQALNLSVPDSDLDKAYEEARQNIPEDAFQQELGRRNLSAADMREGLRRDLLAQKVIDQEVSAKVTVSDEDITAFYEANKPQFNRAEEGYRVAQIAITPVREPQIANRTGDDATTPQEAQTKAQMLMARLKEGTEFAELAADFSEDPQTAARGGDLGFIPVSALRQAPPALRDAVLGKEPGSVQLVSNNGAHTIILVIDHQPAGQRDPSMPDVRGAITEALRSRREQVLRVAYITSLKNDATIVNYLAERLVESQGKAPSLAPPAPGSN
ncbi:MAG: peptidylprolyl isomerase [Vicinamibacterales bacterium]